MLQTSGIYIIKNGVELESKPGREGATQFAAISNLHKIVDSIDVVDLFDSNHNEIGKISKNDFEHITICAVTLDPFTELAAQAQHLKKIGVDVSEYPVWPISIDDIRVYTDIFDNPLVFIHFVEQRMRAFRSDLIRMDAELDHIGMYLKHNVYTQYAKKLNFNGRMRWHGYGSDIDRYFNEKLIDPNTPCVLRQVMPPRLKEVIDFLSAHNITGRRKVSSMLLDCSGEWRDNIASGIDDVIQQQASMGRPKPLSTYGDIKITLFCWQKDLLDRDEELALDHTMAAMLVTRDDVRLLVELIYNADGILIEMYFKSLTLDGIPEADIKRLEAKASTLRQKRIDKAKDQQGKISRNDLCPCGSGIKFKKCCLKLLH
jgi:preprotein translocase subunit SecA